MIPPLSIQQFVEGSDFCWVFFFYTSDQPDFNGPYGFAKSLATYFAERCMVGTINMSYPANQATFHNVFGTECVYEDDRPAYERIRKSFFVFTFKTSKKYIIMTGSEPEISLHS